MQIAKHARWIAGLSGLLALLLLAFGGPLRAQERSALARLDAAQSSIRDAARGVSVDLHLSQGVPWRLYTLTAPDRLVLDFREVAWGGVDLAALDGADAVAGLRAGVFRPGWSRLVAELTQPLAVAQAGMEITQDTGAARLQVTLKPVARAAFDATAGAPHDPGWDLPDAAPVPRPRARAGQGRPVIVVLDPGHGGIDPGAQEGRINEADLMLAQAREIREALLRAGGFEVVMTRDADVFVSLERRVAIAHAARADLFLSLHADSLDQGIAHGTTVYVLSESASDKASAALAERHDRDDLLSGIDLSGADDVVADVLLDLARYETSPRSEALARAILAGIENATGHIHKRPFRKAAFSVLKAADIPSVLIEAGFLSTKQDRKNLTDPIWRAGFAAGVRDGVQAWLIEDAAAAELRRR